MTTLIDKTTALEIATQFLKQHFSIIHMDAVLEGRVWHIIAQIELFGDVMLEKVRIDAETREIHAQMMTTTSQMNTLHATPN